MTPFVPPFPAPSPRELNGLRLINVMRTNVLAAFGERAYGDLDVRRRILGVNVVQLSDPTSIRRVLVENAHNYVKPVAFVRITRPFAGDGLLHSEGEVWRRQRRRLASAFTPSAINGLLPHFTAAAEQMVGAVDGGPGTHLAAALEGAALDAVLRALFSTTGEEWRGRLAAITRDYFTGPGGPGRPNLFDTFARRPDDFGWAERGRRRFQRRWFAEVDAIIAERRRAPDADGPRDLLDLLLGARDAETGEALAEAEIRDQTATFIAAGFETTARLLFWATYLLARAPDEQDRVRAELNAGPPNLATSLDDIARWPRLRCVLQETLRLYPSAPLMVRDAVADDHAIGVKRGDRVSISPWLVHRHRKLWDEPNAFRPERFEGRPNAYLQGGAYIPFSAGPRICIGASFAMAEASLILAALLSRFRVELDDPRPVSPVAVITIRPSHDPRFRLTPVQARAA